MPDAFPASAAVDARSSLRSDGHAPAERLRSHYASPADMTARFGLQELIGPALDQASREADSYLAVRLAVPLDTTAGVPQPLRAFVCDMARYHLTAGFGMQVPEDVEARYKAALAWLKDVAKGAAEIVVPTPPDAPEPQPPETGVEFAPGCHDRFF